MVGLVLGVVVIAVAAVIVIMIVALATRIAKQARTAEEAVEVVRRQTDDLGGVARINDSGVEDPGSPARALVKGGGREVTLLATSAHTYWSIALIIGLVAALVVAALLVLLLQQVGRIQGSVENLLEIAGKVKNTLNIPQLEATAPVLAEIVDEAVVRRQLHERAHGRVRGQGMSTDAYIVLSVVLAVVVIAVLAVALILVRQRLTAISEGLGTLSSALKEVESEHLPAGARGQGDQRPVRGHPRRAARDRPQGRDRRGQEAEMTLCGIGDAVPFRWCSR